MGNFGLEDATASPRRGDGANKHIADFLHFFHMDDPVIKEPENIPDETVSGNDPDFRAEDSETEMEAPEKSPESGVVADHELQLQGMETPDKSSESGVVVDNGSLDSSKLFETSRARATNDRMEVSMESAGSALEADHDSTQTGIPEESLESSIADDDSERTETPGMAPEDSATADNDSLDSPKLFKMLGTKLEQRRDTGKILNGNASRFRTRGTCGSLVERTESDIAKIVKDGKPGSLAQNSAKDEVAQHEVDEVLQDENDRLAALLSKFSEEQLQRYELFRRGAFRRAAVKKLVQKITGLSVAPNTLIAISGAAKVFVCDIIEKALDFKERTGRDDIAEPLRPKHIREAVRELKTVENMPKRVRSKLFIR